MRPALPAIIFWGMLSAVAAAATGLALASNGDYEEELVEPHEWSGIALAALSIALYVLYRKNVKNSVKKLFSLVILILIFVTGHFGGSITHGSEFITAGLTGEQEAPEMKPIPNIQQTMVYTDVVQPLLKSRCYNCHGSRKQKGKLRLDEQEFILKGGESGKTVVPGSPEESEMIERLLLPLNDDDHMPPKGKTQLTKEQIEMLEWWVSTGADFHKRVNELKQPESIKPVLLALETGKSMSEEEEELIPEENVASADTSVIRKLNDAGMAVVPVARGSNYLSANMLISHPRPDSLLESLKALKKQLVLLRIDGVPVKDSTLRHISTLTSLRKLQMSNTDISDQGLQHLAPLQHLRSLNIVGTGVTSNGVAQLKGLKNLKNVYVYRTGVKSTEEENLKKQLPGVTVDFGNYSLPMLEGDTSEIKY